MKILIAYDGSNFADEAIEDLRYAGLPTDAEAVVLSVTDAWELPDTINSVSAHTAKFIHPNAETIQTHLTDLKGQAEKLAAAAIFRLGLLFPDGSVNAEARLGKPAWEIIEKSDEWKADLIVVGSHGRSALGRLLLGSVSQKVLNEGHCSVRVSRKRISDENKPLRVLVAVDGSANAEAAVKTVASRQWSKDTEIRLIAVDDPFTHPAVGYVIWNSSEGKPEDNEKSREWIKKVIDAPTKILQAAGLNVSHNLRWGDAGAMILNEAIDWEADSIFMGARGLGRFQRFWLGSVSSGVAARAECSVEVVRVS